MWQTALIQNNSTGWLLFQNTYIAAPNQIGIVYPIVPASQNSVFTLTATPPPGVAPLAQQQGQCSIVVTDQPAGAQSGLSTVQQNIQQSTLVKQISNPLTGQVFTGLTVPPGNHSILVAGAGTAGNGNISVAGEQTQFPYLNNQTINNGTLLEAEFLDATDTSIKVTVNTGPGVPQNWFIYCRPVVSDLVTISGQPILVQQDFVGGLWKAASQQNETGLGVDATTLPAVGEYVWNDQTSLWERLRWDSDQLSAATAGGGAKATLTIAAPGAGLCNIIDMATFSLVGPGGADAHNVTIDGKVVGTLGVPANGADHLVITNPRGYRGGVNAAVVLDQSLNNAAGNSSNSTAMWHVSI